LAHTRSARKRVRSSIVRRSNNRSARSQIKTYIAKAEKVIHNGDFETAEGSVKQAISTIDKKVQKGIIHRNNAARRKSHLMKKLNRARAVRSLDKE